MKWKKNKKYQTVGTISKYNQQIVETEVSKLIHDRPPIGWFAWFIVFNATLNIISVISCRSVLLVENRTKNIVTYDITYQYTLMLQICIFR